MSNNQTEEILDMAGYDVALTFHLKSRHLPPIHDDFFPAIREAIDLARDEDYGTRLTLPNGVVLSVGDIVSQLHLEPFI